MDKGPGAAVRMGAGPDPGVGIPVVAGEAVGPAAVGMLIVAVQDNLPAWVGEIAAKRRVSRAIAVLRPPLPVASAEVEVAACCRVGAVSVGFANPYYVLLLSVI